ncbi:MAG TPA: LPS export ABC transporter periplasmic protein LptC [Deltaproteobacteria bacterium]|nr:LPS export ABC transporter periplasmic protein LptC [Deltaproteobacteria bacterium]HQB39716.1 LPS export ABC transporter periplasmic protein LptC [Deltaproteobacteria bacterium]
MLKPIVLTARHIRRALAFAVVAAVIGIVGGIFFRGSGPATIEPPRKDVAPEIDLALNKARFSEMREGAVAWVLVADRAEYDKEGDVAFLTGINMELPKSNTSQKVTVTSEKGEYSSKTKNIKLRGKVHLVTEDGAVFDTEWIDYIEARDRFVTTAPVRCVHERLDLTARGMEMDVKSQKAYFHRPVDAAVAGLKSNKK